MSRLSGAVLDVPAGEVRTEARVYVLVRAYALVGGTRWSGVWLVGGAE
ncbi:hypothetical protein [Kribbella sp. NPDC004536]